MIDIVEGLERIVAEGSELVSGEDSEPQRLGDWLWRRQEFLNEFDNAVAGLVVEERKILSALIGNLLGLDAVILDRVGQRLRLLQDEISAAGKLKSFLGATGKAQTPSMVSRAV